MRFTLHYNTPSYLFLCSCYCGSWLPSPVLPHGSHLIIFLVEMREWPNIRSETGELRSFRYFWHTARFDKWSWGCSPPFASFIRQLYSQQQRADSYWRSCRHFREMSKKHIVWRCISNCGHKSLRVIVWSNQGPLSLSEIADAPWICQSFQFFWLGEARGIGHL